MPLRKLNAQYRMHASWYVKKYFFERGKAESTYRSNLVCLICFVWLWERPRDVLKENVNVHGIMQMAVSTDSWPISNVSAESRSARNTTSTALSVRNIGSISGNPALSSICWNIRITNIYLGLLISDLASIL